MQNIIIIYKEGNKMNTVADVFLECLSYPEEREWFEFKENLFDRDTVGEYISALSNSAAIMGRSFAFMFWGVDDKTHHVNGTKINYDKEIANEPFQHYIARNLSPSVSFFFQDFEYNGKRVVCLTIPSAKVIPTSFKGERYIRIGSSKENLKRYPERESFLFSVLTFGLPTINNSVSEYQDLSFNQLLDYYSSRGVSLDIKTYKENLHLLTKAGKYNIMAQLLSDNSHVPIRVAIFSGKNKASKLYSVREFGYKCLLYSLYEVLSYGEILNVPQADEKNRIMERKEIPLFNQDAFREAVINAFLHNNWIEMNEPMITVFNDRIEIISRGSLAPLQTLDGFYQGHSVPVNDKLSELFLQLHISEKTGRGIPTIVEAYGRESISISERTIMVVIPFNRLNSQSEIEGNKDGNKNLNSTQIRVLAEIRNNPNITKKQLEMAIGVGKTAIDRSVAKLRNMEYIKRIGSNKTGYWLAENIKDND